MYYSYSRNSLIKYISFEPKRILDVGCSEGKFGEKLKEKFDCIVWGVEPVKSAYAEASKRLDKVFNGTFDNTLSLGDNKFDLICFNDVLEHMEDPWSALNMTRSLLEKDGKVLASIPNFFYFYEFIPLLLSQDWQYKSSGTMDKTHLRFFTKKSIVRLFDESGFKIEIIEGINKIISKKFTLLNYITLGKFSDMKYLQFLVVASKK